MSLRVQFVSYDHANNVSGVNTWLQRTVPRLRELGIDARVDLLCTGGPGPNAKWFVEQKVPLRCAERQADTRAGVRQCLRWLKEERPDVYVPNCMLPAYFAAAEARRCGIRTIGILHSDDPFYWGLVDEFVRGEENWRLTDLVVVSKFLEKSVVVGAPSAVSLHNIPYGVAIPDSPVERATDVVRIVYTGRLLQEQKRILDLTQAFCRVAREHKNLEAWIVGWGRQEAEVRRIVENEGMQSRVILKGRIDPAHIQSLLSQTHIFVLLSDYEGLPVSLLEAMAAGLVPVCLNIRSGIHDVISHMQNGLIVQNRHESFSDAVSLLVRSPETWQKMSLKAREAVRANYSEEHTIVRWSEMLQSGWKPHPTQAEFRADLELPARNDKFGVYDVRYSRAERAGRWIATKLGLTKFDSMRLLYTRLRHG